MKKKILQIVYCLLIIKLPFTKWRKIDLCPIFYKNFDKQFNMNIFIKATVIVLELNIQIPFKIIILNSEVEKVSILTTCK